MATVIFMGVSTYIVPIYGEYEPDTWNTFLNIAHFIKWDLSPSCTNPL